MWLRLSLRGRTAAVALAITLAATFAGCTDESTDGASPSPRAGTPAAVATTRASPAPALSNPVEQDGRIELIDGLPAGATGPLLIYTRNVSSELVIYDVGAQREVGSFAASPWIALGGRRIVLLSGGRLTVRALDGSVARELRQARDGTRFGRFVVSDDGTMLAVSETSTEAFFAQPAFEAYIVFFDLESGDEVRSISYADPALDSFIGAPEPVTWRDDGLGVVVTGGTASEQPGSTATVMLDGTVRVHDLEGFVYVAPNGRLAADGAGTLMGCMFISGRSITLHDLDSGEALVTVRQESLALTPWEWSPQSDELLFSIRKTPSTPDPSCNWVGAPATRSLLYTNGAPPTPIESKLAARERWYGERSVTFVCHDSERSGDYSQFSLLLRAPECRDDPTGRPDQVDVMVGGVTVGTGIQITVLGFVEVP